MTISKQAAQLSRWQRVITHTKEQKTQALAQLSEAELVERAKTDAEAFGVLYERHVDAIFNYVYYRTSDRTVAEDLTARTFYNALNKISSYVQRGAPFTSWLYRIAHNLTANWHRDQKRWKISSLNDAFEGIHRSSAPTPQAEVERRESVAILMDVIAELPDDRQQLLLLKYVENMSNAEISRVMGRTEGAVKSLYHRTLIALRRKLKMKGFSLE